MTARGRARAVIDGFRHLSVVNRPEFSSAGTGSERRSPESARTDHMCTPGLGIAHRTGGPLPGDRRRNGSSSPPRRASENPTQTATRPGPQNAPQSSRCRRERAKKFVKQLGIRKARPVRTTQPSTSIVGLRQHCSLQNPLGLGLDSLPGRVHPAPQPIDDPAAVALLSSTRCGRESASSLLRRAILESRGGSPTSNEVDKSGRKEFFVLNVLDWIVPMAAVLVVFVVGDPVLCDSQTCRQRIGDNSRDGLPPPHDHRAGHAHRHNVI